MKQESKIYIQLGDEVDTSLCLRASHLGAHAAKKGLLYTVGLDSVHSEVSFPKGHSYQ